MDKDYIIIRWSKALAHFLECALLDENCLVVIYVLSRKMPRIFSHILKSCSGYEEVGKLEALLVKMLENKKCIITTEIAIPFIHKDSKRNIKTIVLDDIIISGQTLQAVCSELKTITGEDTQFLSLYSASERIIIKDGASISKNTDLNLVHDVDSVLDELAKNAKDNGLPVDIEFPILYIDKKDVSFVYLQDGLKRKANSELYYSSDPKTKPEYFVQIQSEEKSRLFNNDFAKIRVFDTLDDEKPIKIVGYAPNILSEKQIQDTEFFKAPEYQEVWNKIHLATIDAPEIPITRITVDDDEDRWQKVQHRRSKSLNTMANYLLSLSMLMRQLNGVVDREQLYLKQKDVELLLGWELAEKCMPILNNIVNNFIVSPSEREAADVPPILAPFNLANDYEINRTMAISSTKECHDAIAEVFIVGEEMERAFINPDSFVLSGARNMHFLESYQSLQSIPKAFMRDGESIININREIDEMIDNGYVIPIYEVTTSTADPVNGPLYWRRYFRGSHLISHIQLKDAYPYKIEEDID